MSANASVGVGVPHGGGVGALSQARPGTLALRGRRVDAASVAKAAPSTVESIDRTQPLTAEVLGALSKPELLQLRALYGDDLAKIRTAVNTAKRRARKDGDYSDGDWLRRAETALAFKGRAMQRIDAAMAEIRAANRLATAAEQRVPKATPFATLLLRALVVLHGPAAAIKVEQLADAYRDAELAEQEARS